MPSAGTSKAALDVAGLLIASALFALAAHLRPPIQNVLLGVATSFVFFTILDILLASQKAVAGRRRTRFFGSELCHGQATFAYPDFEPHRDIKHALASAGTRMRYQRPTSHVRALADFWIDVPLAAASNDIEAMLDVAAIFEGHAPSAGTLITDRQLITECNKSFVSFGLASSACTYLYLQHAGPGKLFDLIPESAGSPRKYARASDGQEFHSDNQNQYGVILRYAPDPGSHPGRRWFIIGGLGPQATVGAASYLAENWRNLARLTSPDEDFAAFISVPVIAPHGARPAAIITGTRSRKPVTQPAP
jgi:hypothetical protein